MTIESPILISDGTDCRYSPLTANTCLRNSTSCFAFRATIRGVTVCQPSGTKERSAVLLIARPVLPAAASALDRQLHPSVPIVLELVAQHLAAIALGQLRHHDHLLGHLRRRQVRLAMLDHVGLGQAR